MIAILRDLTDILANAFAELSQEYDLQLLDKVPFDFYRSDFFVEQWKVMVDASIRGRCENVEFILGFKECFPFTPPYVLYLDTKYGYLPHISYDARKICLYPDSVTYDCTAPTALIRETIHNARRYVERFVYCDNRPEFKAEIDSYWSETYEDEPCKDSYWLVYGDVLSGMSKQVNVLSFPVDSMSRIDRYFVRHVVVDITKEPTAFETNLKWLHSAPVSSALYLASFTIPEEPPYFLDSSGIYNALKDDSDRVLLKKYLNEKGKAVVLFRLGPKNMFGGVKIDRLNVKRNGFRTSILTPYRVFNNFEEKAKKRERIVGHLYSPNRIVERTSGMNTPNKDIVIAGLGSIGSNLCYFLNGYDNAGFTLVDTDILTVDNIGRHLLGFEYVSMDKVSAVADFLLRYRPDRNVRPMNLSIEEALLGGKLAITDLSFLFVCIGNLMSEKFILEAMKQGMIRCSVFVLWLEPYAISGTMLYINPRDSLDSIVEAAAKGFERYRLICSDEYDEPRKFTKKDAGCNGTYALYSGNDVIMFLTAMYPYIDSLLRDGGNSKCVRWIGNINIAQEKGIKLKECTDLARGMVREISL